MTASVHGEMMDRVYRRQRHIYDLSRKFFLLGRDRLIGTLAPPPSGHVLEIGCGTARNLIAVAQLYPGVTCYGVDVSRRMLATARAHIERSGLSQRIVLGEGDAADFDSRRLFGRPDFDRIFFSYSLSMIPSWSRALEHASTLLSAGGSLQVVDFGQQERLPRWFRTALFGWIERFHVAPRADLERVLRGISAHRGGGGNKPAPGRRVRVRGRGALRRHSLLPRRRSSVFGSRFSGPGLGVTRSLNPDYRSLMCRNASAMLGGEPDMRPQPALGPVGEHELAAMAEHDRARDGQTKSCTAGRAAA